MSNEYFNFDTPLARDTLARAESLNSYFQTIASGFEKLPTPAYLTEGLSTYSVDSGSANQYEITMSTPPTAYTAGLTMSFLALAANTGASTVNVYNAVPTLIGAIAIKRVDGAALAAGDIVAGALVTVSYDGTNFQLVSPHGANVALASASAAAALVSENAAAASFLSFDIRYLGAKAVAPTLDNDGNALITGATFFNTAVDAMYVWDGAAWILNNGLVGITDTSTSSQIAITDTKVTFSGNIISDTDSVDSLGSTGVRWLKVWADALTSGTMTLTSGSITDSSGAISFGNENLSTTGSLSIASMGGNWTNAGRTVANMGVVTTMDLNGGTIDGAVIGGTVKATGSFNALVASTAILSGILSVDDTTDSTSITTGSIHTDGGLGVAKKAYFGDELYVGDNKGITLSTDAASDRIYYGHSTTRTNVAGHRFYDGKTNLILEMHENKNVYYQGLIISYATGANAFSGSIVSNDTTDSISATTGSIQTDGGLGVAKSGFFGGDITIAKSANAKLILNTTTANSINSGEIEFLENSVKSAFLKYDGSVNKLVIGTLENATALEIDRVTGDATFSGNVTVDGDLNGKISDSQSSANLNLTKNTHANTTLRVSANTVTWTITNNSGAWEAGDIMTCVQQGGGQLTIAVEAGAGYTLRVPANRAAKTRTQYSMIVIQALSATEFVVGGDLEIV